MKKLNPDTDSKWMLKVIVMQTIAANLGSMLTPLGNPQNLYLYGKAGIGIAEFLKIMLPEIIFTAVTTLLVYRLFLSASRRLEDIGKRRDTTIV